MTPRHRTAFEREMAAARGLRTAGDLSGAFAHLQRAHVLGQRFVVAHIRVHAAMLVLAAAQKDIGAAWGQAVRILLGAVGSSVGRVPVGNTGGSDIGMFEELPIDPELEALMREEVVGARERPR